MNPWIPVEDGTLAEPVDRMGHGEILSLREWLASWGDGPNWSDPSGQCVPMAKVTALRLLDEISDLRRTLFDLRGTLCALVDHADEFFCAATKVGTSDVVAVIRRQLTGAP